MSYYNDDALVKHLCGKFPPFLEAIATKQSADDTSIGLTPEGRTVRWMRTAQKAVTCVFSNLAGLIGMFLGAIYGAVHAVVKWDAAAIRRDTASGAACGSAVGIAIGTVVGSLTSAVVVPFAGVANIVSHLHQRRASPTPPGPAEIELVPLTARA